jgi:glycosyltransferase involved in cell wall biosynthesis
MSIPAQVINIDSHKYSPYPVWAIARLCKQHQVDLVHAHLTRSTICALLAHSICKTPIIVHEHGPVYAKGAIYNVYRSLLKMLRRRPAAVIANSKATARRLQERIGIAPEKITVIYNAIDLERFDPAAQDRDRARAQLGIAKGDFVAGFLGRLQDFKGVDILIRAVGLLLRESRAYRLVIVGDGPERAALEALAEQCGIADRVDFLGVRSDVEAVIPAFDVAVMPSRHEPFGIVLLELMRMKAPVISSGVDGMAELVSHEETALVAQPNTPETLADCIRRLEGDAGLRARLAENGHAFTQQFGLATHIAAIEDLYTQTYRATHGETGGGR